MSASTFYSANYPQNEEEKHDVHLLAQYRIAVAQNRFLEIFNGEYMNLARNLNEDLIQSAPELFVKKPLIQTEDLRLDLISSGPLHFELLRSSVGVELRVFGEDGIQLFTKGGSGATQWIVGDPATADTVEFECNSRLAFVFVRASGVRIDIIDRSKESRDNYKQSGYAEEEIAIQLLTLPEGKKLLKVVTNGRRRLIELIRR